MNNKRKIRNGLNKKHKVYPKIRSRSVNRRHTNTTTKDSEVNWIEDKRRSTAPQGDSFVTLKFTHTKGLKNTL